MHVRRQYIHKHIHTYIHTYVHTYIHTYIRTHIHIYIYTYIHTYIHIYIHIHTYIEQNRWKCTHTLCVMWTLLFWLYYSLLLTCTFITQHYYNTRNHVRCLYIYTVISLLLMCTRVCVCVYVCVCVCVCVIQKGSFNRQTFSK